MPYDSSLDKEEFSKTYEAEITKVIVSVHSYNNRPKKLQITRENRDGSGTFRFTKLGRLAKEELQAILPIIQEAMSVM
jgi:hypothetical protein